MTDIDYRFNAQERIKVALKDQRTNEALVTAQIAQAEATLALVEQQRIANLIALTVPQGFSPESPASINIPSYDQAGMLRDDIRKGLGL